MFVVVAVLLDAYLFVPFDISFRVACAGMCLAFIAKLAADCPGERSLRIGFWFALIVNIGVFFTPLVDRPASRGELMVFALPDAIVVLGAGIACYPVTDPRGRSVRQLMILGLVVAFVTFAALIVVPVLVTR
ncbi:hypothetical protein ASE75_13070 [Sphingomonas sp. Leaf17]|nr:hypothetical protein ASE75_13070 [Sphingomonas sp. Leaf17]